MSIALQLDPILEPTLAAVRRVERFLGPEDDWVEEDRRIVSEAAQSHLGHLHTFVYHVGEADYILTTECSPDQFERVITPTYQRNLLSGRKYRTGHSGGKQWAVGSYVIDPTDERWQHHVYIFPAKGGGTDVYAHKETSVREGAEHLTDKMHRAEPHNLFDLLDHEGVEYESRNI